MQQQSKCTYPIAVPCSDGFGEVAEEGVLVGQSTQHRHTLTKTTQFFFTQRTTSSPKTKEPNPKRTHFFIAQFFQFFEEKLTHSLQILKTWRKKKKKETFFINFQNQGCLILKILKILKLEVITKSKNFPTPVFV